MSKFVGEGHKQHAPDTGLDILLRYPELGILAEYRIHAIDHTAVNVRNGNDVVLHTERAYHLPPNGRSKTATA